MTKTANPILIGIIAGLVAAIGTVGSLAVPFFGQLAAMIALFMAGLGYGRIAGLVAVVTAAVVLGVYTSSLFATFIFGVMLLPAAVMSQLASLARPAAEIGGPDQALAWYPLADMMMAGAVVAAFATIALLLAQPSDVLYDAVVSELMRMFGEARPDLVFTDEQKTQMISLLKIFGPMSQSAGSVVMLFAGFYFSMRILSSAGRNVRPREDIRSSLRMNRASVLIFFGGIILMFAGGTAAVIGASFAGAVGGGFLISGYAVIHNLLRDKPYRLPALVLVYLVSLLFPPIAFIVFVAGGLANPRRAIALTPRKPAETTETKN